MYIYIELLSLRWKQFKVLIKFIDIEFFKFRQRLNHKSSYLDGFLIIFVHKLVVSFAAIFNKLYYYIIWQKIISHLQKLHSFERNFKLHNHKSLTSTTPPPSWELLTFETERSFRIFHLVVTNW